MLYKCLISSALALQFPVTSFSFLVHHYIYYSFHPPKTLLICMYIQTKTGSKRGKKVSSCFFLGGNSCRLTLYIYIYTQNFWRNLSRKIMGGHFSKRRKVSSSRPSWFDQNGYPGSPLVQPASYFTPQHHLAPSSSSSYFDYGLRTPQPHMLNRRYSRIADNYYTLDQVSSLFQEISQKR